ncbi:MAG: hypothetical protein OCU20_09050 [Methanophagales archaeon]|nr:hypothetical protein [Methanophagales archaeon]
MKNKILQNVKELQNALTVAGLNYEIWWIYKEKESRERFVDTLNAYPLFFQTSLHAHFVAMIIALYRLFETRKDTVNIPQLIKLFKKEGTFPRMEFQRLESEIEQIKPLWIKVSILRNKLFGHRSNALDNEDIWKEASVTPNEFKKLIEDSKRILNEMTSIWNRSSHAFNLSATEDTMDLLEDLKSHNEERL